LAVDYQATTNQDEVAKAVTGRQLTLASVAYLANKSVLDGDKQVISACSTERWQHASMHQTEGEYLMNK
jgi:hypothetical protein